MDKNANKNIRRNFICKETATIKSLKEKDVIYVKADKGSKIVIMDKNDYDERVTHMINDGPYQEVKFNNGHPRNPLKEMIKGAVDCKKSVCDLTNDPSNQYRLHVSNPKVASLYALPKIHKNPISMRPICSNVNVPTEKLAGWLLKTLSKYPVNFGCDILNSIELVNKIKDVKVKRGQILCSFDLQSMYTNIPVTNAIESLKRHLTRCNAPPEEIRTCIKIAETCMEQNYFTFCGKFYKQTFGLSMGCKLSPYLANIFMCELEEQLKKSSLFPSVWHRYVDDVFLHHKRTIAEQVTRSAE